MFWQRDIPINEETKVVSTGCILAIITSQVHLRLALCVGVFQENPARDPLRLISVGVEPLASLFVMGRYLPRIVCLSPPPESKTADNDTNQEGVITLFFTNWCNIKPTKA